MNKVSFSEENSGLDVKSSMVLCSYFLLPMVERLYDGDLHGADGWGDGSLACVTSLQPLGGCWDLK